MFVVGNYEFDWGLFYLMDMVKVYMNFVVVNIIMDWGDMLEWVKFYWIVILNLKNGGMVWVVFVGLIMIDMVYKMSLENIKGLVFVYFVYVVCVEIVCWLKKEGKVDMVVFLMYIGINMKNRDIIEEENVKLLFFLKGVDVIIFGYFYEVVFSKVNDVFIIQVGVNGIYIGKLDFRVVKEEGGNCIFYIGGDIIWIEGLFNVYIDLLVDKVLVVYGLLEKLILVKDVLIYDCIINKWEYILVGVYVIVVYVWSFLENEKVFVELKVLFVIGVNYFGGLCVSILVGEVIRLCVGNVFLFGGNVVVYEFMGEWLK